MEKKLKGLGLIKAYRAHPEDFLPLLDHTDQMPDRNEYGDVNIGWYAGMMDEKRPFFVECWANDGITIITLFVSTIGIEDKTPEELDQWFQDIGYYRQKDAKSNQPSVLKYTYKRDGKEYFSINVSVGIEDEPAYIEGAPIFPWSMLNEYNSKGVF